MNNNHYPSLELCKKLKEVGFPETEKGMSEHGTIMEKVPKDFPMQLIGNYNLPCPSVMEMLDVIPRQIKVDGEFYELSILKTKDNYILFYYCKGKDVGFKPNTLPNALADMVIWLVENKYLSFNK